MGEDRVGKCSMSRRSLIGAIGASSLPGLAQGRPDTGIRQVFVGSYTFGPGEVKTGNFGPPDMYSQGIYNFPFDLRTGRAGPVRLAAETPNPSNLILHPTRRFLYAGSARTTIDEAQHRITAFAVEGGTLRELNHAPSGGGIPTQGVVSASGRHLITTNFESDNVVSIAIGPDGRIGAITGLFGKLPGALPAADNPPTPKGEIAGAPKRTPGPGTSDRLRPHMALLAPGERFVLATAMARDGVEVLAFDRRTGRLAAHDEARSAPGSGPRHLAFGPGARMVYSADEESATVTNWAWDGAAGRLRALQQLSTLPVGEGVGSRPAHVAVHPAGRFLYVNNRGHGSLAAFAIDPRDGRLTPAGWTMLGSPVAWHFEFDPTGRWLLVVNQSDSTTQIFAVEKDGGILRATGQVLTTPLPTSLHFA